MPQGRHNRMKLNQRVEMAAVNRPSVAVSFGTMLESVRLAIPSVIRMDGATIEWHIDNGWRDGEPARDCLWQFIRLADAQELSAFLDFSKRFGVLGITDAYVPGCSIRDPLTPGVSLMPPHRLEETTSWFRESADVWRVWATVAKAILVLVVALRDDRVINPTTALEEAGIAVRNSPLRKRESLVESFERGEDAALWYLRQATDLSVESLADNLRAVINRDRAGSLERQRAVLTTYTERVWLHRAGILPSLDWSREDPILTLGLHKPGQESSFALHQLWPPNSLFNIVAVQLSGAYLDSMLTLCTGCRRPHVPAQKARDDQPHYCSERCRCAAKTASQARRRKKRREEVTASV